VISETQLCWRLYIGYVHVNDLFCRIIQNEMCTVWWVVSEMLVKLRKLLLCACCVHRELAYGNIIIIFFAGCTVCMLGRRWCNEMLLNATQAELPYNWLSGACTCYMCIMHAVKGACHAILNHHPQCSKSHALNMQISCMHECTELNATQAELTCAWLSDACLCFECMVHADVEDARRVMCQPVNSP